MESEGKAAGGRVTQDIIKARMQSRRQRLSWSNFVPGLKNILVLESIQDFGTSRQGGEGGAGGAARGRRHARPSKRVRKVFFFVLIPAYESRNICPSAEHTRSYVYTTTV
jgi:hypothetical protein